MMSDLELIRACAEAMGEEVKECSGYLFFYGPRYTAQEHSEHYNPLHNDAQAFALMERFRLNIGQLSNGYCQVFSRPTGDAFADKDLKRAICKCVAKMPKA